MSIPGCLAQSPCMIATTSGIGVGFVRFPPTSGAGSRGAEPVSVDSVLALPTLPPPYPDRVPSALPLPAWDTTAIDDKFSRFATGQLMDTRRERFWEARTQVAEVLPGVHKHSPQRLGDQFCRHRLVDCILLREFLVDALHLREVEQPAPKSIVRRQMYLSNKFNIPW
jgi:hypothetical protein